jgi:outer membrane protein OmpA-like peptidoglycan-associated protein
MPEWIYSFNLPVPRYAMKLQVVSGKDKSYLPTAGIKIYTDKNGQADALISSFSQEKGGAKLQTIYPKNIYHIKAFSQGYYPVDTVINTDTLTHSDTFSYVLHLQPMPKDTPIVIKNIFFRFNEDELTADSKKVLDTTLLKYMQKNPDVRILILSHTDSIGTAEYNLDLSQKRAESIVRYLVNKGISPQRLVAKGYGSKYPIAPNTNKDGTDNPEGRAENRRTEFRIIPSGTLHPDKN